MGAGTGVAGDIEADDGCKDNELPPRSRLDPSRGVTSSSVVEAMGLQLPLKATPPPSVYPEPSMTMADHTTLGLPAAALRDL